MKKKKSTLKRPKPIPVRFTSMEKVKWLDMVAKKTDRSRNGVLNYLVSEAMQKGNL